MYRFSDISGNNCYTRTHGVPIGMTRTSSREFPRRNCIDWARHGQYGEEEDRINACGRTIAMSARTEDVARHMRQLFDAGVESG